MPRWCVWLGLLAGLVLALTAQAKPPSGTLFVRVDERDLRAVVEVRVGSDWHLYHTDVGGERDASGQGYPAKSLVITPTGPGVSWSEARVPQPERFEDLELDNWANVHRGTIHLYLAGRLAKGATGSDVSVRLSGSACSDEGYCVRYYETLEPVGEGGDDMFAAFPADLTPKPEP